ncbi:unnamed protein product [Acanthoscelides obtectus]|uniref:Protein deadpan n=1 Tax=Acanthoscelides obtectus TaxID=200917 RepID=A0A9P0MG78_ACAOB|nr:unnamed protein product [Acanthoscelides obtectus]CAH2011245.1 unnamed protein product [Acanthoscelides obtectus]CAK1646663.1 Protein deadpan [Acanthoscelides obtectus]CAK1646929.1 Protein deadpan [Acanthoscelides obtectus]
MSLTSEDEFECKSQEPQTTMSKAELRKTHKPIMEKRRRARINHCLNEIKNLILEAMNKDPSRHSKLEKADILEMAVKHLQNVQRQQLAMGIATDPTVLRKFKNGFNECATEIDRYLGQMDGVEPVMKQRVNSHLLKCIGGIEHVAQLNIPGLGFLSGNGIYAGVSSASESSSTGDQNNNPRIQIPQGIQLIPSRLPSGELALLVPNSSNLPYFPTVQRPSAFAAVIPSTESKSTSPPVSPLGREELKTRNPSPHGFRPVLPSKRKFGDDHQVPQVSSTMTLEHGFSQPLELKTLKFPMQKKLVSPKKHPEPLGVITNQSERYRQAQMKDDSAHYEENAVIQGIKRKYSEEPGLLSIAQPQKMIKTHMVTPVSVIQETGKVMTAKEGYKIEGPSCSKEGSSTDNGDMWRPW